jgi:hypothetical protein
MPPEIPVNRDYIRYAIVPGIILAAVTAYRCHLERTDPTGTMTKVFGINIPSLILVISFAWLLRKRAFFHFMKVMALLLLLIRLPVGICYGLAWANHWVVEKTGEPVRYITDHREHPDMNAWLVFLVTTIVPLAMGLALAALLGFVIRKVAKGR